jgi:phthalate 4,5-dioxygenase reductase subunit
LDRYIICVKREENGEGGSKSLCDEAEIGSILKISEPTNDFPLTGNPSKYIFIAGGIGITPIYSMIQTLRKTSGKPYKLYYLTRDAESTAYLDEFQQAEFKGKVSIHHTQGNSDTRLDLWPVFEQPKGAYVYCCGPRELMEDVKDMTGHWSPSSVHFEDFVGAVAHKADDQNFRVKISDDGNIIDVGANQTIIEALRQRGYEIPSSCESGTCGTCRTKLVNGEADHRDLVLTEAEQGKQIMICVSRALDEDIEIELPSF